MPDSLTGPSRTAALTAVGRALHREHEPPRLLDDPYAMQLAGELGPAIAARLQAELPPPLLVSFCRWISLRTRFPEDVVETAAGAGPVQYVVLGAGLDSFAWRRRDLAARVRVFEVDHPATQKWKRDRLAEIGAPPAPGIVFAPVDFERQTLQEGLSQAGFDFTAPAVFSWIGVTMYLSAEAIDSTLATVAGCAPGTRLVLTYNQPASALQGKGGQLESVIRAIADDFGEHFVSLYTPPEAEALLISAGYVDIQHVGPEEAVAMYFPGRDDVRFAGAQRLIAGSVPGRA